MNIPESILGILNDEQRKKIEAAQTPEELLAIAKEEGLELADDLLQDVSGGKIDCPNVNNRCLGYTPQCPNVNNHCLGYTPQCPNVNTRCPGLEPRCPNVNR